MASADTSPSAAKSWSSAVLGAEGLYAGALPPPGFHFVNYTYYYAADALKGRHGGDVSAPPFTDFKARVLADVFRPIYVSKLRLFGANVAWHACIPVTRATQKSDFFEDTKSGLGDIYVSPLILGWHSPPWHWVAALDVICPTGEYYSGDVTTIGHNHWTFEPAFAVSYLGQSGLEASAKFMYDFHTEDPRLDYKEGQQLHIDWSVSQALGQARQWRVGLSGYMLRSLQDDKVNGSRISGSKEQVFAVGPSVAYRQGSLNVELKVMNEFAAKNRPEGTAAWLKLTYSF